MSALGNYEKVVLDTERLHIEFFLKKLLIARMCPKEMEKKKEGYTQRYNVVQV